MIKELPVPPPAVDHSRKQLLENWYESIFPTVARFVKKMGGDLEEAKDIFQEALVIYYEKETGSTFQPVNPEAYLLGIARHLWVRKYKKDQHKVCFDDFEKGLEIPSNESTSVSAQKLVSLLEQSGQKCLQLLKACYYDKFSMKKIRDVFGYGSEHSATVQKYKCIQKIRNQVKSKALNYEDFLE